MLDFFTSIDDFVWGPPLLVLLVGTGIYLTIRLGLLQIIRLPKAFKLIFAEDKGEGDISSFAALATALAATIGTGNIVGVATAIKTGGPGALFWMWIAAFFGMATKYADLSSYYCCYHFRWYSIYFKSIRKSCAIYGWSLHHCRTYCHFC